MKEVVLMKFVNGEEVIATLVEYKENYIAVKDPMCLAPNPDQPGALIIFPWSVVTVPSKEESATLYVNRDTIVFTTDTLPKNIVDFYIQQTSGIIMPSDTSNKKLII